MSQANLSGTENIRLTGTVPYPKKRLGHSIKAVLLNPINYRFLAPAFLTLLSLATMPDEISASGVDYLRMVLAWIVILIIPGFLLLPLISRYFEPDWLEALVLSFALSFAFNTIPLMSGFLIGYSFNLVLNVTLVAIALLSAVMFVIDRIGITNDKIIYRPIDLQIISLAFFTSTIIYIVAKFGAVMLAVGDEKVYLGRIIRILEVPSLSSSAIEPFKNGGIHPGYALPIWQLIHAAIAKLSGVNPTLVWFYINPFLTLIAVLSLYFFVRVLFKNRVLATFVVVFYTLPGFFVGDHVFKVLPGLNVHGDNVFESLRLLAHPVKLSMLILFFLIGGFFIAFIRSKKTSYSLLVSLSLLLLVQAFVHVSHLFYIAVILTAFTAIFTLLNYSNEKRVIIRSLIVVAVIGVIALGYFFSFQNEVKLHGDNPFLGAQRYLDEGRLIAFAGGYLPSPKEYVNTLPILLLSIMFVPMVGKNIGMAFLFANILSVFFIAINPWVYAKLADILTFTQMDRFLSNVWLNWLLSAIFIYLLLAFFTYIRDRIMEEQDGIFKAMTLYIAWFLIIGYFVVSWMLITAAGSLGDIPGILIGQLVMLILIISLFLSSYMFPLDTSLLERIFKTRPDYSLVILFLACFLVFSYLTSDTDAIRAEFAAAKPFPSDPIRVQGNNDYVSQSLIKAVRRNVPVDKVIISDPGTSQVLTSFVPRYVATYVGGHQSTAEVGEDVWERMKTVNDFFKPGTSIDKRRKIINKYDADYIIVNLSVFERYGFQTRDLLPELKILYLDDDFKLYKVLRR